MGSEKVSKDGSSAGLDGLQEAIQKRKAPQQERRMVFATMENSRHLRHAQVLSRWPLLPEGWARRTEETRLGSVDRTPGAATFGR